MTAKKVGSRRLMVPEKLRWWGEKPKGIAGATITGTR
jgi:hypothetical protein